MTAMIIPKKKTPLTVEQVCLLEKIAFEGSGQLAIFAGSVCFVLYARLRWMDGQHLQNELVLDLFRGRGFLESELYHHKNSGRNRQSKRLLPAACVIPGVSGLDWASSWLNNRKANSLAAGPGKPTMPAPLSGGFWALTPLEPSQATAWLRETLRESCEPEGLRDIATHSIKSTLLSWMSKASCETSLRRIAGYHVEPSSKIALEYSRDGQAPVLHALQGIFMAVQSHLFLPDCSRARRPKAGCGSLVECMEYLSRLDRLDRLDALPSDDDFECVETFCS